MNLGENMDLDALREYAEKLKGVMDNGDLDNFDYNELFKASGIDVKELDEEMRNYKPTHLLGYKKLHSDAVAPKYNYPSDSGFDLYSTEEVILEPFGRALIPTGLSFDIKDGFEIQVRSKSGLAINQGLMCLNSPGTVDNGYTGEVKVILFNTNNTEFKVTKGMKVAQAVLCPVVNGSWVDLQEKDEVSDKDRADNGFGSTGI
jgi:dUTP pyrophosphatase